MQQRRRCDSRSYFIQASPSHTQTLLSYGVVRRLLPETTPFFDIGLSHRTPQGEPIPHLIVRCGANHVNTLSDIISMALDGAENSTALYLPSHDVSSMTVEESHSTFHAMRRLLHNYNESQCTHLLSILTAIVPKEWLEKNKKDLPETGSTHSD
jgi:hypothetical protein